MTSGPAVITGQAARSLPPVRPGPTMTPQPRARNLNRPSGPTRTRWSWGDLNPWPPRCERDPYHRL